MTTLDEFLEFEKENHLFALKYAGVYFWHLMRFNFYQKEILGIASSTAHPDMVRSSWKKKLGFVKHLPAQMMELFDSTPYQIFASPSYRPVKIGGKIVDSYTCFLSNMEFSARHLYRFDGYWPDQMPSKLNNALPRALCLVPSLSSRWLSFIQNRELEALYTKLADRFSLAITKGKFIQTIRNSVMQFKIYQKYFRHILSMGQYKAVFLICHYALQQFALIAAARELGIPTIEHQHGAISEKGIAYHVTDLSSRGKYFPDILWTFGDYWNGVCHLPEGTDIMSVGSPLLEKYRAEFQDSIANEKVVTFYSQGPIGANLSKLACEFAKLVAGDGHQVVYKLHPSECKSWREIYPWLIDCPNLTVIDTPVNIYECLARSKYCVGVYSSTLYEALCFHCQILVYHLPEAETVRDMIDQGAFTAFDNAEELRALILSGQLDTAEINREVYWKSNALGNIQDALNKIIQEGRAPAE